MPKAKRKEESPSTAIVPVEQLRPIVVQGTRTRELSRAEIDLLKRTVAKGTSDDEFALFLWVARKHRLDPLTRQLHCVMRWTNKHHQDEKDVWVGGFNMTIQTGIDGYRSLAARDHPDYGGCDEPEFVMSDRKSPAGRPIPEKATIRLWKKGFDHPVVGVAYWDEFAPADLSKPEMFMWSKMPRHMLAKCAEALALRKGYPELADIYTDEEMHQASDELTPGGYQIVEQEPRGSIEAAQSVADRKIAEYKAKKAEALPPVEKPVEKLPTQEKVTLTHWKQGLMALSGPGIPILKSNMNDDDLAFFNIRLYNKNVWAIDAKLAFKFQDLCARCNVSCIIMDAPTEQKRDPMAPERASIPPQEAPEKSPSKDPILTEAKMVEASGKKPFMSVTWNGRDHSAFDKKLWPLLTAAKGLPVTLETKANGKYSNVVQILTVDGVDFTQAAG